MNHQCDRGNVGRDPWRISMRCSPTWFVVNLSLAIFNLIPLPPLDGYHVLNDLVLKRPLFATQRAAMAGQGMLILLMVTDILPWFLGWALSGVRSGVGHAAYAIVAALGVL